MSTSGNESRLERLLVRPFEIFPGFYTDTVLATYETQDTGSTRFSSDDKIITVEGSNEYRLFDVQTTNLLATIPFDASLATTTFSDDNNYFVALNKGAEIIYSVRHQRPVATVTTISKPMCDTSYPPRHFVVGSTGEKGGWYAPGSPRRIEYKAKAHSP